MLTGTAEPGGRMPTTWTGREPGDDEPSPVPEDGRLVYGEGLRVGGDVTRTPLRARWATGPG